MIFNELYSAYYNTVAKIISLVIRGDANESKINEIVNNYAFGESILKVWPSLKNEKWQLVRGDFSTPVKNPPTMPLTLVQKQWLKAIMFDPRAALFDLKIEGLDDVEPLFTPDDYVIYDKYLDADPFADPVYVKNFKTVLSAIKNEAPLKISLLTRKGRRVSKNVFPQKLEYSEKDDKFRLIGVSRSHFEIINLGRILSVEEIPNQAFEYKSLIPKAEKVILKVTDERNALERAMLHFAHFEKRAEKVDEQTYLLHLIYNKDDETELVIRVLSFGPLIEAVEPPHFRNLIIERLKSQMELG